MALALIYDAFAMSKPGEKSALEQIPLGIILGGIGIAIMMNPWEFLPGIIFDTRSVLLCVTGFFFGTVPTLVTIVLSSGYRFIIGGSGVWTGVAVIITSGVIGLAWRYWQKNDLEVVSIGNLYALGMVTHIFMLLWMLTLPRSVAFEVLSKISIPILLVFPLATVLLGKLMINRLHRINSTIALKESEKKYRNLVGSLQEGIWVIDIDSLTTFVNPPLANILGYTVEEMVGRHLFSFMDEQYVEIAKQKLKHRQKGIAEQHEFEFLRKDGTSVNVIMVTQPIKDDNGNYSGAIAGVIDITERKRAEKERERLLTAIEQTDDMVIITAPDGEIQYVNPAFEAVTGYTPADVLGQNLRVLKSGKQDQAFYRDLWKTLASGKAWKGRMVNKRKDGTLYTEESTISPVTDSAGRIVNFVSVKRDITKHLRISKEKDGLAEQLQQAQKMESVGRLAGGVAHDFNNMLSIIIGYAELAMEKVEPTEPLYSDLMDILNAAKRSSDITRQLLAFARQQTTTPKILDLNVNIESMLKMLRRLIGEDIDLSWLPGADLWPVKIDPSQVDQILANFCVNARDAMKGVGKLTIETGNTSFDEEYCAYHAGFIPGRFVLLAVSDTGNGMAPEILDKIFEPFFTTKNLHRGTGLGLSTVYGIVKQNNGFINVYSEPEKGTTFKIYLPQYMGQIVEGRRESTEEIPLSQGETILVVEDDASILKLSERMLKKIGYTVLSANSPGKAIELTREHADEINLLLTDVVMPEMNGRELSEQLKKQCSNLKTLFMSGYTANVIAHRGVLEEGIHFIAKPLSIKELAIKVRETLDNA